MNEDIKFKRIHPWVEDSLDWINGPGMKAGIQPPHNFRYWYHDDCERKRYQNGASHDWIVKPQCRNFRGDLGAYRVNVYQNRS